MTSLALSGRRPDLPAVVRLLGLLAAAGLLGLICGRVAMSHYGPAAIAALVGIPVLVFLWPRPLLTCMILLTVMSVVAYGSLPRVNVPGHPPINVGDVLVGLVVLGTIWRRPWRTWPTDARHFAAALLVVFFVGAFPTIRLLLQGHDPAREAILGYKNLLFLGLGLTVAVEFSGRLWRPALNWAVVVATIIAVLSVLAAASGSLASFLDHFDANSVQSGGVLTGGAQRIRLPGLFFVYAMFLPTLAMALLIKDRWRLARALALVPMLVAIAVSFNRNMYFGVIIGLVAAVLIGGPRLRHRLVVMLVVLAATLALVIQSAVLPAATAKVEQRAGSSLSSQVLQSSSIQDRSDEFAHALRSIEAHPWLGVGWFQNYGSYDLGTGSPIPRLGVEDLFLHLATDLGVPLLLAFIALVGTVLGIGFRRARAMTDPVARALVGAGVGALIALLISCLVGAYLQDNNTTAMFGLSCGLIIAGGMQTEAWQHAIGRPRGARA